MSIIDLIQSYNEEKNSSLENFFRDLIRAQGIPVSSVIIKPVLESYSITSNAPATKYWQPNEGIGPTVVVPTWSRNIFYFGNVLVKSDFTFALATSLIRFSFSNLWNGYNNFWNRFFEKQFVSSADNEIEKYATHWKDVFFSAITHQHVSGDTVVNTEFQFLGFKIIGK